MLAILTTIGNHLTTHYIAYTVGTVVVVGAGVAGYMYMRKPKEDTDL